VGEQVPGLVVLVTGVNRFVGSELAGRLAAHPGVARVIGVDATLPEPAARTRMGGAEFARADIRNPLVSRILEAAGVDTVVHASASASPASSQARTLAKEMNVLGTMQLLAACQRSGEVRNLIVRSTTAVYGQSYKDPAICTETTEPRSVPGRGPARDAIDIEGYVRGFARRRPDVRVAVPRLAEVVGPTVQTPLTRYFSLSPVVPTVLGHDVRLQLVHENDAVRLLEHLVFAPVRGTVNVAGDGVLMLSQAIHRAGRIPLPLPLSMLDTVGRGLRALRLGTFSPEQVRMLQAGRVVDTTRLRDEVGFVPEFSTAAAFDDFAHTLEPTVDRDTVRRAETRLLAGLGVTDDLRPDGPPTATPDLVPTVPRLVGIPGHRVGPPRAARRTR
jgi:UDP-glucose 4-epimerase